MILFTIRYPAPQNHKNNQEALRCADLGGWRIIIDEVRKEPETEQAVHHVLTLVFGSPGKLHGCSPNLVMTLTAIADRQHGQIFALETQVDGS